MERIPFAMRAMSKAAVDAGLIDGSKTEQERERALFKLMEQGQLISGDILPHFGKELQNLANNNDELSKALTNNLSPALGRASNSLVLLQKEMFDGMKPSIMFALDGFTDLSKESGNLAYFLGKVLGGAILTVSTLIRLPIAAFIDLTWWMSETLGLSEKTTEKIISMAGAFVGAGLAIWTVVKAFKALRGAYRMFKGVKDATKAVSKGAPVKGGAGVGAASKASGLAKGIGRLGGPLATFEMGRSVHERFGYDNVTRRHNEIMKYFNVGKEQPKSKLDINLNLNGGLGEIIDAKVDKRNGEMIEGAYINILSGSER